MQHGTLLTVHLWLILQLVNYGQTDDICGAGKIRRGEKCCLSQFCEDTGFTECTVNNTKDTCLPCNKGFYVNGQYETSDFSDPNVCAQIKECSPEEVKNADGECVCDVSRGYYRIDEGICGLVHISCTPAGRQLSLNGQCDPCPEGYFKPVSGKERCSKKSNITCSSTEIILEGNTTTDRKCVKNDVIASTSTYSPPLSTYINITNDVIDRNGNDALLKWVIIAVVVLVIVLSFVVVVMQLVLRHPRLRRRQQSQDFENHEDDEHVQLQPVNGELPIVDLENDENTVHVSLQRMNGAIPIVDDDTVDIGADLYPSPQDNIPNDDDNFENAADLYQIPQDNILNDEDNFNNSHTNEKIPYQSPQDSIPNVTDGPQAIDDGSHSCGEEVITSINSQTYVKQIYTPHDSSIDNAIRGDMPSRDEHNSNQDDGPFSPLSGVDRSCQGALGGYIDGNVTAPSFNNENDDNRPHYQPSSEHNPQQDKLLCGGPRSFDLPVKNSDANLPHPPPHFHGHSDGDDSGFQN